LVAQEPSVVFSIMSTGLAERGLRQLAVPAPVVSGRCLCRRVLEVRPERGLRHFLRELLVPDGRMSDGVLPMRCRVCEVRWSYHRIDGDPWAAQMTPENDALT
jgi:hypothetical protein